MMIIRFYYNNDNNNNKRGKIKDLAVPLPRKEDYEFMCVSQSEVYCNYGFFIYNETYRGYATGCLTVNTAPPQRFLHLLP